MIPGKVEEGERCHHMIATVTFSLCYQLVCGSSAS